MSTTIAGPDGKTRCGWCSAAPEFLACHDTDNLCPAVSLDTVQTV